MTIGLFALMAGLGGMILPVLSGLLGLPTRILVTYMLDVVQLIARIPHALVKRQLSLTAMLFLYACVLGMVIVLWRQILRKHGKITDKNILD
jgi:hypothetical protein